MNLMDSKLDVVEIVIAAIAAARNLDARSIGLTSYLHDLGVDSIGLLRIANHIADVCDLEQLRPAEIIGLFDAGNVAHLVELIREVIASRG